jgi:hypothetical protein
MASKITIDTSRLLPPAGQTSRGRGGAIVQSTGGGIVRSLGQSFSGAVQEITNVREKQQQQTFTFLSRQLQAINNNILAVANNITALTSALQADTRQEEANIQQTRVQRIRSAEKESFGRAENILENRIVRALTKPVKKVTSAVQGGLDKLKNALMLLFVGWLGDKIFKMFQADAEGNEERFNELKKQVGIALAAAGGAFLALNGGLLGIMATIGGIAASVAGFLLTRPFAWLKNLFLPARPPVSGDGGRVPPAGGGSSSGRGQSGGGRSGGGSSSGGRSGGGQSGGGRSGGGRSGGQSGGGATPRGGGGIFGRLGRLVPSPIKNNAKRLGALFARPKNAVVNLGKGILPFLGRLLAVAGFVGGAKGRMDRGQSPAQAVLGYLPEFLLTYGGATLGLKAGALAGGGILSALTAIAGAGLGGMLGGMLGQPITNLIDQNWNPEWDKALAFINDPIRKFLEDQGMVEKAAAPASGRTSTAKQQQKTGEMSEGLPVISPPSERLDSLITQQGSDARAADLAQRGPAEGTPTLIDLTGGMYGEKTKQKEQIYPSTNSAKIPNIPTADLANPFRDFARSIYNVGV